jgi:hypothetical protein
MRAMNDMTNSVNDGSSEFPFIVKDAGLARWLATQGFAYQPSGEAGEVFAFEAKAEAAAVARGRHERRLEQWRRYGPKRERREASAAVRRQREGHQPVRTSERAAAGQLMSATSTPDEYIVTSAADMATLILTGFRYETLSASPLRVRFPAEARAVIERRRRAAGARGLGCPSPRTPRAPT